MSETTIRTLADAGHWLLVASFLLLLASAGTRWALGRRPLRAGAGSPAPGEAGGSGTSAAGNSASGIPMAPARSVRYGHLLHGAAWALITVAVAILVWFFVRDAFAVRYVAGRSSADMALVYKVAALWAGQEGSLLFWLWIQTGYGFAVSRLALRRRALDSGAALGLSLVSAFFAALVAFVADPFAYSFPAPPDGAGMNPILQSYWMTVHPVMLYLGYIGLSVPFAYGAASLYTGDEAWIRRTRRWALVGWTFLSLGIIFGARWAYEELGWGGYWGWDPVENASFMPWLIATAFIHSGIIQEQRGMLKRWNHALILIAYLLTVFGTLVTRSGILSSVHAFVESDITPWFIGFLGLISFGYLYGLTQRWPELADRRPIESPLSREASFLANNVVLLATCFAIFWGTVFPLVAAALGRQVTVGTPYFDRVTGPLFLALVLLMGIGPALGWRRATSDSLQRHLLGPALNGLFMLLFLLVVGVREIAILGALPASALVLTAIAMEFARGVSVRSKSRGEPVWLALPRMMNRSPGRYGGYVVHAGILFIAVGVAVSTVYQSQENVVLAVGEQAEIGPYTVRLYDIREVEQGGVPAVEADLLVARGGKALGHILPSKRFYPSAADMGPTTETAVYGNLQGDLYAVLAGWEPYGSLVGFKLYYNPLVWLIWTGAVLVVLGGAFAFWPRRSQATAEAERALASLAELEYDYLMGKVGKAEYDAVYGEIAPRAMEQLRRERSVSLKVVDELAARLEGAANRSGAGEVKEAHGLPKLILWALAAVLSAALCAAPAAAQGALAAEQGAPPMDAALAVPSETIVLKLVQGRLAVLDLITVTNISGEPVSEVRLPVAKGATGLGALPGLRAVEGAEELVDSEPLLPGESRRYTLQYEVPAFRWPSGFAREILHPTERLYLLWSPDELEVSGIGLAPGGVEELAGQLLFVAESAWIAPGTVWQAILRPAAGQSAPGWDAGTKSLPVLAAPDQAPGSGIVRALARAPLAAGVLVAALVAAAAWAAWTARTARVPASPAARPTSPARAHGSPGAGDRSDGEERAPGAAARPERGSGPARRGQAGGERASAGRSAGGAPAVDELARIVRSIARLELAYAEGAVSEGLYRRRRARMMELLVLRAKEEGVAPGELRSRLIEEG